jgi:methionyl-tRNA formyltransferase
VTERARTIFLGSGSFAVPIVETLAQHPLVDLVAVVTAPTRIGSRGRPTETPVAQWAAAWPKPTLQPARLRAPESIAELAALAPELLVLADYGQIVPQAVLDLPEHGALNIHPSLLPRHRGASPIPAAILAGDEETGVTLMLMDAGLDSGPIVAQSRVTLHDTETGFDLEDSLARVGEDLLYENLEAWLRGDLKPVPQDESAATTTRPLRREDGRLDPEVDAETLARRVRAYQPWPGTFFETDSDRVIVLNAHARSGEAITPGEVVAIHDRVPAIATANGLLELVRVQPAGGKPMTGVELLRGRPQLIGSSLKASPKA